MKTNGNKWKAAQHKDSTSSQKSVEHELLASELHTYLMSSNRRIESTDWQNIYFLGSILSLLWSNDIVCIFMREYVTDYVFKGGK